MGTAESEAVREGFLFLGDWVVIISGVVGFLANCAWAYATWRKGKRYHDAYLDAMKHLQRRLSELNTPQYSLCPTCGKIVLGACPECAALSKIVG